MKSETSRFDTVLSIFTVAFLFSRSPRSPSGAQRSRNHGQVHAMQASVGSRKNDARHLHARVARHDHLHERDI